MLVLMFLHHSYSWYVRNYQEFEGNTFCLLFHVIFPSTDHNLCSDHTTRVKINTCCFQVWRSLNHHLRKSVVKKYWRKVEWICWHTFVSNLRLNSKQHKKGSSSIFRFGLNQWSFPHSQRGTYPLMTDISNKTCNLGPVPPLLSHKSSDEERKIYKNT